jgi:hypothetical protein
MKQCPFCAGAIPEDATLCKHCKQALPSPRVAPAAQPAAQAARGKSPMVWIGGMFAGALLVVGIVTLMAFRAKPAKTADSDRRSQIAEGIAAARNIGTKKELCSNPAVVADAWRGIKQAQKADPQWDEAKQMTQQLEVCRAEIERTLSSTLNDLKLKARQDWAQRSQSQLQARVLDASVTLSGATQGEALIAASQLDQGMIERVTDNLSMAAGSFLEGFQKVGGVKVIFSNGKRQWPYDLPPIPEAQDNLSVLTGMGLGAPLVLE